MAEPNICIIGCGKMGSAILSGWLNSESSAAANLSAENFTVVESSEERAKELAETFKVRTAPSIEQAITNAAAGSETGAHAPASLEGSSAAAGAHTPADATEFSMFLIAVKPQVIDGVLESLNKALSAYDSESMPLVVSIAAGVPTARIASALPAGTRIVRTMPNTPLQVGEGATVVCAGPGSSEEDVQLVQELFAALGFAEIVDESQVDIACALSGGGPAYFCAMVEALAAVGVEQGLSAKLAYELALHTASGTFSLMNETGQTAAETRKAVCSPGGTTLAALDAMAEHGFQASIDAGIVAAVKRAKELAK